MTGRIPAELNGRYLRNGPNPLSLDDPSASHLFLGEGMIHGVRLRDGRAEWYRNRWVRNAAVARRLGEEPRSTLTHEGMDFAPPTPTCSASPGAPWPPSRPGRSRTR
ncbi:carotenoid oxygenase family protein [Nonomuraea ferruginea]